MDYRVLGSVEVRDGGRTLDLGPPKQRALLAALLLHANEPVATDRLIDWMWEGRPPRTAAHSVQVYVSGLRKQLDGLPEREVIVTRPPGYALVVDPDAVDATRFQGLVEAGSRLVEDGDAAAGAEALREALALWRGPPLADVAYMEFAQPHIQRLEALRLQALEQLAAAGLAAGRVQEAVTALQALVAEEPLRERAWELLLLGLYRAGRQAEALRAYGEFRRLLADELGIDPAPPLQQLHTRILLQDPGLATAVSGHSGGPGRNPYKGLRAFREADAAEFFGRRALVDELCAALAEGVPMLAVVGPSGSGKSSVVHAGLVPALRSGAVPGSEDWEVVALRGGAEVRQLGATAAGVTAVVVIDQFEDVFLLADEATSTAFLDQLVAAVDAAAGRLRVVVTLRADFYDRPLRHSTFARLFTAGVVNVMPLTAPELEAAVVEPARQAGVDVAPGLVAELITDSANRSGALPLLQHTLRELFDHRDGEVLTADAYHAVGGLQGAVSRRAEAVYTAFGDSQQEIAEQVFIRLVALGQGAPDTRRRVPMAELNALDVDPVELGDVLERFGRHRLVTFDRDLLTGEPTVELAHEALIDAWQRLRDWVEARRGDLRRHRSLAAAIDEWESNGRDPDYLLTGARLRQYETWSSETTVQLTTVERGFLDASLRRRRTRAALVIAGRGDGAFDDMIAAGFDRAVADFGLSAHEVGVSGPATLGHLHRLAEEGAALVIGGSCSTMDTPAAVAASVAASHPATTYVFIDMEGEPGAVDSLPPNVVALLFAEEQGSFLVGAAAGLKSRTGKVGFIGGVDLPVIWKFEAGFTAGAQHVDPAVEVVTAYLTRPPDTSGWTSPTLAGQAAEDMYDRGVDVIFHAASRSGLGVFEAAVAKSEEHRRHLWAIGVDSDQYEMVAGQPASQRFSVEEWRRHILTSMVKRLDQAVHLVVKESVEGTLSGGVRVFDLPGGGVDYATSGGHIDDIVPELERLRHDIVDRRIVVPTAPPDRAPVT